MSSCITRSKRKSHIGKGPPSPFLLGLLSLRRTLASLTSLGPTIAKIGPNLQRQFCQIFHGADSLCGGRCPLVIFAYDGRFVRERAPRRDGVPNRNDERISHSTRVPHFGNSADPDYRRFLGSASQIFFFLRARNQASRTPCLFSVVKRIASDSWHFSHDLTARRPAAGQLRRRLSKNRCQCPSTRFFWFPRLQSLKHTEKLSEKVRSIHTIFSLVEKKKTHWKIDLKILESNIKLFSGTPFDYYWNKDI